MIKGPITKATLRTSAVLGFRLLAQSGTLLLVARLLGPQRFGAFAGVAALAILLGSMSTFGMHLVLLRETSRSPEQGKAVLPIALGTTLACGTALFLLYLAVSWLILRPVPISPEVVLCIGLAELLLHPFLLLTTVQHQASGRIARSQFQLSMPLFLRLGVAALVWGLQPARPLEAYAWGYLGASLLTLLPGLHSVGSWPMPRRWKLPSIAEWRDASGFAVLNLTTLGPSELDKPLALRLLPLAAAGMYAASARVIGAAVLPVIALVLSALPRLFREAGESRDTRLLRWMFAAAAGYGIAAAIGLWFVAPVLEWLFGPKYQGMTVVLHWLTIAVPGMALRFAGGGALMARGRPWWRAAVEALGLCVLCMTAVLLTANSPLYGMPLALACAEWSMAVAAWLMVAATFRDKYAIKEMT